VFTAQKENRVFAHLDQLIQRKRVPGIQYTVIDDQDIRFEYCGGRRDISGNLPVTAETSFMASSTTKVLTAGAVLQLIEQGKVGLDESLSDYYTTHPYGKRITIRHLLNHTSGIPNPLPLRWLHKEEDRAFFDEDAALQNTLNEHPVLAFSPGEKYSYSNIAYWLLGKVIEATSGLSYCDYLKQYIFAPLGISPKELSCAIPDLAQYARGYLKRWSLLSRVLPLLMDRTLILTANEGWTGLRPVYMNGPSYGGLIGTARGFSRFLMDQLRIKPMLFSVATKKLFFSVQRNNMGQVIETTLGWHRGRVSGMLYYGQPGGGPGFQSNARIYADKSIATVWLANRMGIDAHTINTLSDSLDQHFLN